MMKKVQLKNVLNDEPYSPIVDVETLVTTSGETGQVLGKTDDGIDWVDIPEGITNEDVEKAIDEALYESVESVECVDLGLPSGLLWATCNLGANKETDYGLYFQWGDTKGYKTICTEAESDGNDDAHYFDWRQYKYSGSSSSLVTKYNTSYNHGSFIDNKTILEPEDDAATIMLGSKWRMPTVEDFQELIDNTVPGDNANQYGWITNYKGSGVDGLLLKSKVNNNTIFFPAAGSYEGAEHRWDMTMGVYGSSSLGYGTSSHECVVLKSLSSSLITLSDYRYYGHTIRGVFPSIGKKPKFQPSLPEGEPGQILTKTEDGVEWSDMSEGITKGEVEDVVNDALFEKHIDNNGYDYVDMGDAGVWATCNVGATKPEEKGFEVSWGETQPKNTYTWGNYKFCYDGDRYSMTKYNNSDGKTVLDDEDDAARVNMGGSWRTPSVKDYMKLYSACNIEQTENYNGSGVGGAILTLRTDSSKKIFLPGKKWYNGDTEYCRFWTNELCFDEYSCTFTFVGDGDYDDNTELQRYEGLPIRATLDAVISPRYITKDEGDKTYESKLPDGEPGQVLTKTEDGVEWKDIEVSGGSNVEFPDGEPGQVLTKTSTGVEFKNLPGTDGISLLRITRDEYNSRYNAGTLDETTLYLITG